MLLHPHPQVKPVRFGVVFTASGRQADPREAGRAARLAEEAGLDSFLVWDHYMLPQTSRTLEALALLGYLAGRTERIRLGTCVTPLPLRPPGVLAKTVATLDVVSGGRIILGVGAGWHRPEFEAYSEWLDDAARVDKTEEALRLLIDLWTKPNVSFSGRYYRVRDAALEPKPVQRPHPPLWFGTVRRRMLRLMVEFGSGWIPINLSSEEYASVREGLIGRVRSGFVFANVCWPSSSEAEMRKRMADFQRAGCDYYLEVLGDDYERQIEWMSGLGRAV